ncbi:HopJ type III effector protein [Tenacibaculum aiptasiae]|uniref:HopJ type III effector protein n=1 Tax=Tenacibaculum aiptasiae TaxID=426481 RepID=A0A7J5ANB1_9FLAO|nr:HopJ type III effector protein [Tenacibaculum aiptasiae]KAB1159010.1 HopJ type III effector protein [Tenacibaculum aiptasiae]
MTLADFTYKLKTTPTAIIFSETMAVIEELYEFRPSAFKNGNIENSATQNLGSCKVFAFAIKQQFTKEEALACFGQYYFKDVLENPNGTDHQNIRNFMQTGFEGLVFEQEVLVEKEL